MSRFSGPKIAIEMVAGLDPDEQKTLLENLAKKDPQVAEYIAENLVTIDDLIYLTPKMLVEYTREIDLKDLGLSLRIAKKETRDFVSKNLSRAMREEVLSILNGPPKPVRDVEASSKNILAILKKMMNEGKVIINKSGRDEYV